MSLRQKFNKCRQRFPNLTSLVVWILAALVLAGLTIKDFVPILRQYKDENTQTNAYVILENLTFSLPDLALCVKTDIQELIDLKNRSAASILIDHDYGLEGDFLTNRTGDEDENFLNFTLIKAALTAIYAFDFMDSTPEHVDDNLKYLQNNDLAYTDQLDSARLIPLADLIVRFFCIDLLETSGFQAGPFADDVALESYCSNLTSSANPYLLASGRFCFPLPFSKVSFTRDDDSVTIYLKKQPRYLKWTSIAFYDNAVARSSSPLYELFLYKTKSLTANFRLSSTIQNLATKSGCQNDANYDTCMAKCRVRNVRQNCKCTPFTYRLWAPMVEGENNRSGADKFCRKADYQRCLQKYQSEDEMLNSIDCREQCQSLCTYSFYQWSFQEVIEDADVDRSKSQPTLPVKFRPESFSYIEFILDDKMSVEQFLTQVGGLLNFYVGCSGLTIFTALLALTNWLKRNELVKKTIVVAKERRRSSQAVLQQAPATPAPSVFDPATTIWQWWWVKQLSEKTKEENKRRDEIREAVVSVADSMGWTKSAQSDQSSIEEVSTMRKKIQQLETENSDMLVRLINLEKLAKGKKPEATSTDKRARNGEHTVIAKF